MNIKEVELYTQSIKDLKDFYVNKLKLPMTVESDISFSIQVGNSLITFREMTSSLKPIYHLAINIPENKIEDAIKWTESKVQILNSQGSHVVHFEDWNANSIYFYDPTGNIIEFIARHNLDNSTEQLFSESSLLCVSEIGIPADDVVSVTNRLINLGLNCWGSYNENFSAVGDEDGLLILVKNGRPWFMTDIQAYPHNLTVRFDDKILRVNENSGIEIITI